MEETAPRVLGSSRCKIDLYYTNYSYKLHIYVLFSLILSKICSNNSLHELTKHVVNTFPFSSLPDVGSSEGKSPRVKIDCIDTLLDFAASQDTFVNKGRSATVFYSM